MINLFLKPGKIFVALALLAAFDLAAPAQTIIQNFAGLTLTDVTGLGFAGTPPDTMGAAGTNQFVVFINGGFAIYTKAGVRQSFISDEAFWTNAGISLATMSAGLTDPRIIYDAASGRWFASEITANNTGNKVLVGRSNTADPAAGWKALFFTGNTGFADYDTLGVDSTGVYIGVHNFSSSVGSETGVSFFSIPKTDLLAATPTLANMTKFENLSTGTYGTTLQGVVNPDAGFGHGLFISIDDSLNFFDRYTINGSGAAGATLGPRVRISNTYDGSPNPAKQPSGQTLDALDDRFSGAVKQIGKYVFMANTILQGSKDAVHWIVLNETNNVILGEGIISDPAYDFFQPSIAASHNGKILMAFNRCGTNSPAGNISIYAAAGTFTNSSVTMGAPFLLKQGTTGSFSVSFDSQPYRWGDYSATMIDPTDDELFWTIQEIPASSTSWGTQITLISMATNPPSLSLTRTNTTVKLNWPLSTDPAFVLQSTTNLTTAVWATVTNAPVISINQNIVTLTLTNKVAFFRLKK